MDEEGIGRLIAELRDMMMDNGFGWAAEQAEAGLPPRPRLYLVALALIDAAEAVTVKLAQAEIAAIKRLDVEQMDFMPDPEGEEARTARVELEDAITVDDLRGADRRELLVSLSNTGAAFEELRRQLND